MKTKQDKWQQHVSLEIQDASIDQHRLLEITNSLMELERKDLIPEDIASDLFSLISFHNTRFLGE